MRIAVAGGTGTVGRYVVQAARDAGHHPVVLSRTTGVDLRDGAGLAEALDGAEAIVDVTNVVTASGRGASAFFTGVTRRLQEAGAARGVANLVTLSIVGIDRAAGYGYYGAKLAQEEAAAAGPVPSTVVRATQFHEFPAQVLTRTRLGPVGLVPRMPVQPVAARAVGAFLVEVAAAPSRSPVEVAGPEEAQLLTLARLLMRHRRERVAILPLPLPGAAGRAMRRGALLPSPGAHLIGPPFTEWLASGDADAPSL